MLKTIISWLATAALISAVGGAGYVFYELKTTTLERDLAACQNANTQNALTALKAANKAQTQALNQTIENDNERNNFITQNALAIERARQNGDGPLSPVLRDALERVRDRYAKFH
jgi:hypothetical protein